MIINDDVLTVLAEEAEENALNKGGVGKEGKQIGILT